MGWDIEFTGHEFGVSRVATITHAVYFQEGRTTLYLNPEKGSYGYNPVLAASFGSSEALLAEARKADPPLVKDVDEWHYQLLDSDGIVLGHGDGYVSEDHVVSALASLLEGRDVQVMAGRPGEIDAADAALGKRSATGSPHCTNCGTKVVVPMGRTRAGVEKNRAARDYEVSGACGTCGATLGGAA